MTDILIKLARGDLSYSLPSSDIYKGSTSLHREAIDEIKALRKRIQNLEASLEPSSHTKSAYIGEFSINVEQNNPEYDADFDLDNWAIDTFTDEELGRFIKNSTKETIHIKYPIDWTTVKDIMKFIKGYADGLPASL